MTNVRRRVRQSVTDVLFPFLLCLGLGASLNPPCSPPAESQLAAPSVTP